MTPELKPTVTVIPNGKLDSKTEQNSKAKPHPKLNSALNPELNQICNNANADADANTKTTNEPSMGKQMKTEPNLRRNQRRGKAWHNIGRIIVGLRQRLSAQISFTVESRPRSNLWEKNTISRPRAMGRQHRCNGTRLTRWR